jgi:hypothetical protein
MNEFHQYKEIGGIVITTINPKGNLEHQLQCLKAWKDLGLRVISFNSKKESETVSNLYGRVAEIIELDDEATALAVHGTPAPRIKPVLQLALKQCQPEFVFLTNSDIYPSFRKAPLLIFSEYPAYAFTRKEVISITSGEKCHKMYRGGLDVFAFNATALARICGYLEEETSADQMAFGIPGWDYFMGATLTRPEIGGIIVDGTRFWHKSHRTTYSQIDEFAIFVPYLVKLGFVRSHDCSTAASEFAAHIDRQCGIHAGCASTIELIYGDFESNEASIPLPENLEKVFEIIESDPILHPYKECIGELDRYLENPQMSIDGLQTYLLRSESSAARFKECLIMIYLTLLVRRLRIRKTIKTRYPAGNRHRAMIKHILSNKSFYARRYQLAELFFNEYLNYDMLNRSNLKALAISCMNDAERSILKKIILFINHDAAN